MWSPIEYLKQKVQNYNKDIISEWEESDFITANGIIMSF